MKTLYSQPRQYIFFAGYNDMERIEKTSTEVQPIEWEFSPILPQNEILSLASSSILIIDDDGIDVTSSLAGVLELIDDTRLRVAISTGTNAVDYIGKFIGVSSPHSYRFEGLFLLQVRDQSLL
jgi:hypothetical protein